VNERLKELALESKLLVEKRPAFSKGMEELNERLKAATDAKLSFYYECIGGKPESQEVLIQKFAELIVRECVNQHPEWWAEANADVWSSGPFHYIPKAMMKHFGVKDERTN